MTKTYDIPRTSQGFHLEEADEALEYIEHLACLGLGSDEPEHWQAALFDILQTVRNSNK